MSSKKTSTNQDRINDLQQKMKDINKISKSFCLAKWLQSTVYLHNGMTHSCHHPTPHKIPLDEIHKDPSALHNTSFKKEIRKQMLAGERPKECHYCWNIEDLEQQRISDRMYKSTDQQWAYPHLEKVVKNPQDSIDPTYLEVAFDYTCNFKCAYCSPDISSKWHDEINKFGPYPTSGRTGNLDWIKKSGRYPIAKTEKNPYVDAFWSWWPKLKASLNTFRITGGEPLLSRNTWRVLQDLESNPAPKLNLAINTNLGVPDDLIDRLIGFHNRLEGNTASFEIYTSCEAHGDAANYIRYGMDYSVFISNIEKILQQTQARVNLMITFNALSVPSFSSFLNDIWHLRRKYNLLDSANRIPIMVSYLRWPEFMSMRILPEDIKKKYALEYQEFVNLHSRATEPGGVGRFYLEEIDQINRLCEFMLGKPDNLSRDRKDFAAFFNEYDARRGSKFNESFPDLVDFKEICENTK